MESIYTELALYGSKNECARTDNVFFLISEVGEGTVSLSCKILKSFHNTNSVKKEEEKVEELKPTKVTKVIFPFIFMVKLRAQIYICT